MNTGWIRVGSVSAALLFAVTTAAHSQAGEGGVPSYPLGPLKTSGQAVGPMFEGWYRNPDGTYTLSFGYYNPNTEEVVEVPIGPDNFIEPAEFNGMQPTHFPPVSYGGYDGRRERGVFAITVPADFAGKDVWWTVRSNGRTERVPGRVTSVAYELSLQAMAMGSLPPSVWFEPGKKGSGPAGIVAEKTITAKVGVPVELTVFAADDRSERTSEPVPLGVTWTKHQGAGQVQFGSARGTIPVGSDRASTTAVFSQPGEYMIRVRVDNFRAIDSAPGDQCCWTNGYLRVNVTQ